MITLHLIKMIALALVVLHAMIGVIHEAVRAVVRPESRKIVRIVFATMLLVIWIPICFAPVIYYSIELNDTAREGNHVDDTCTPSRPDEAHIYSTKLG